MAYADLNRPQKEKPLPVAGGGLEYASIVTVSLAIIEAWYGAAFASSELTRSMNTKLFSISHCHV